MAERLSSLSLYMHDTHTLKMHTVFIVFHSKQVDDWLWYFCTWGWNKYGNSSAHFGVLVIFDICSHYFQNHFRYAVWHLRPSGFGLHRLDTSLPVIRSFLPSEVSDPQSGRMCHQSSWGSFAMCVLYSNPYFLWSIRAAAVVVVVIVQTSVIWKILTGVLIPLRPFPCMDCSLLVGQKPWLTNLV